YVFIQTRLPEKTEPRNSLRRLRILVARPLCIGKVDHCINNRFLSSRESKASVEWFAHVARFRWHTALLGSLIQRQPRRQARKQRSTSSQYAGVKSRLKPPSS